MILTDKKLSVLIILAAVLVAVTLLLYSYRPAASREFQAGSPLVQGLDVEAVHRIDIRRGADKLALVRKEGKFVLSEWHDYPAATDKINRLLIDVLDIRAAARVTTNPANHAELGVAEDSPEAAVVRLAGADEKPLAVVIVGKDAPTGGGQYVRLAGQDAVYTTGGRVNVPATFGQIVHTFAISISPADIEKVTVENAGSSYTLAGEGPGPDDPVALTPLPTNKQVKNNVARNTLQSLAPLPFEDVLPSEAPETAEIVFDTTVTCQTKTYQTYKVRVGQRGEDHYVRVTCLGPTLEQVEQARQVREGEPKEELEKKAAILTARDQAERFAREHGPWVFKVTRWTAEHLRRPLAELVEDIPQPEAAEQIGASHILIAYAGSERSEATRGKEEARKLAGELEVKAKAAGADFAALARANSDCPSKDKGGDLGTFEKGAMHPDFEAAAWALPVGKVSGVVETPFGFHIIKRTR